MDVDIHQNPIHKEIMAGKYLGYYLIYNRRSTDEPDSQKNSIQYQKLENTKFARREKLSIAPTTLAGFCLDGMISEKHSGFKEDDEIIITKDGMVQYRIERPKFQRLVHYLSLNLFKGVICLCWDRISRNKGDDTILRKLMRKGIDVRFVFAHYEKTSSGALHMDIDGMFAEHHSRVTSEKVRLTTWNLRERGIVTYKAPVGYLNKGDVQHKPFDPVRAPIIKKMFELYATGDWSLTDLVRFANNQGLTTSPSRRRRTESEMLAEEGEESKIEPVARPIILSHVQKILTNPFYTGRMIGNDKRYARSISHEPLISDDLFNAVQVRLAKKKVSIHYTEKLELFYRGFVRCADCGRVYTPYTQKEMQYFGARCKNGCPNSKKSFSIQWLERKTMEIMELLVFTKDEQIRLDAEISTNLSVFEEKRLEKLDLNDRRKRKLREDLAYLWANKIHLLKSGVYAPEALVHEENRLNRELISLQSDEQVSDISMQAIAEELQKLSELLKSGLVYYEYGKSLDREQVVRLIFSELSVSDKTFQYQCKKGFQVLKSRLYPNCSLTTWISESLALESEIKGSLEELRSAMKN